MMLDSYISLGNSGLKISPICLGTMTFGQTAGWGSDEEESCAILREFVERGGNFLDTANNYANGRSEEIIGAYFERAGRRARDRMVIATKFFNNMHFGDPNGGGAGRKAIIEQCEASLRRLRTDYIDLYWLHNWFRTAPIDETMRALDDLVTAGKVRYVGASDTPAWKVSQSQMLAQYRGWAPFIAIQVEYSLLQRTVEGELVPMAQEFGLGVMPWSPLKAGLLTGKYGKDDGQEPRSARGTRAPSAEQHVVIECLKAVAEELGTSPANVALSWLLDRPQVPSIILGTRTLDQFRRNLSSLDIRLIDAQRQRLDDVSRPALNFPAEFNARVAPSLAFAGATVDGVRTEIHPMLLPPPPQKRD